MSTCPADAQPEAAAQHEAAAQQDSGIKKLLIKRSTKKEPMVFLI
jgi:hypothetical protein